MTDRTKNDAPFPGGGPVITIDGPVGVGKSSVAKILAKKLGYRHIDSGAMYRAVAYEALRQGISPEDEGSISSLIDRIRIEFKKEEGRNRTYLCDEDVSDEIRSPLVSQASSEISTLKEVRKKLVALQRQMGEESEVGVIMEGRDIGTVVFPDADVKFFLDGSAEERARRRHRDMVSLGMNMDLGETLRETLIRDDRDSKRELSPLKPAEGSFIIDSTHLGVEEVVSLMLEKIGEKLKEVEE